MKMRNRILKVFSLFLILITPLQLWAQTTVLDGSSGFKKLKITDPTFRSLYEQENSSSSKLSKRGTPIAALGNTNEVVIVNTLQGVLDAGLPYWIEDEILADAGYSSWTGLSQAQLNAPIDKTTIVLDSVTAIERSEPYMPSVKSASSTSFGDAMGWFCSKSWHDRTKNFSKSLSNSASRTDSQNNITFSGDFSGNAGVNVAIKYRKKKRCGITYKLRFDEAKVAANGAINGSVDLTGSVGTSIRKTWPIDSLRLFDWSTSGWISYVQYTLDVDLDLDLSVDLDVDASASIGVQRAFNGNFDIEWTCTADKCSKTKNVTNFGYNHPVLPTYEAEIKIVVTPKVDSNIEADFDVYWGLFDIAKGRFGIVTAMPVTLMGYYGNGCSDANGDGLREFVEAGFIDINAEIYAYLGYDILGYDKVIDVDLQISGWARDAKEVNVPETYDHKYVYRKNLYFNDLLGSTVLTPVIDIVDANTFKISNRSCFPFSDNVTYQVDWGDGSLDYVGNGGEIDHNYAAGTYSIQARMKTDSQGRNYDEIWTTHPINISSSGHVEQTFYNPTHGGKALGFSFASSEDSYFQHGPSAKAFCNAKGWPEFHTFQHTTTSGSNFAYYKSGWRSDSGINHYKITSITCGLEVNEKTFTNPKRGTMFIGHTQGQHLWGSAAKYCAEQGFNSWNIPPTTSSSYGAGHTWSESNGQWYNYGGQAFTYINNLKCTTRTNHM